MASLFGNGITVSQTGFGWRTGAVVVDDQPTGFSTVPGSVHTLTTITGTNQLGAGGGSITLVTPYVLRLRGDGFGGSPPLHNRAGYSTLQLVFTVPEPASVSLLAMGLAACVLGARRLA